MDREETVASWNSRTPDPTVRGCILLRYFFIEKGSLDCQIIPGTLRLSDHQSRS